MTQTRRTSGKLPWTRGLSGLAVVGPALALGGVHPVVLAAWTVLVGALVWRIAWRSRDDLVRPWPAWVLLGLAGWTALAALPIPGLRGLLAPSIEAWVEAAVAPAGVEPPPGLSVRPADTLMEAVRLVGLAGITLAAAQLSWRLATAAVAACGLAVAGVGFVHAFLGTEAIYGLYTPHDILPGLRTALLGTFVNPNHQSGLLLLALFCAAALAVDQLYGARTARDAAKAEQRRDRGLAMLGAIALLLPALLLSLSRGALIALALFGPAALGLALRKLPSNRGSQSRHLRRGPLIAAIAALTALVVGIGRHGAWAELLTLFDDPSAAYDEKLGPAAHAPALIARSPILGTGRGTFIDLFPLEVPGSDRVFTHLESTPITAVLEWGPLVGGGVVLAGLLWWIAALRRGGQGRERKARAIVLLGIAALGLQSIVDFSLEFIGVAAPLLALVGALTPHGRARVRRARLLSAAPVLGVLGGLSVMLLAPHTWGRDASTNAAVASGEVEVADALRWRPVDGALHAIAARRALERGDVDAAAAHADFATRTRAGSVDAWLLLSEVHARRGEPEARDAAVSHALDRVHAPVPRELVDYLQRRYPDPEAAAAVTPSRPRAFAAIVRALREAGARDHADAMARDRSFSHPDDPTPLLFRSQIAAERNIPALALHFALLARATDPRSGAAHLAVVRATVACHGVPAGLEALEAVPMAELAPDERDQIDELRVRLLLQRGGSESVTRARALAEDLLLHSPDEAARTRRRALVREASEASP